MRTLWIILVAVVYIPLLYLITQNWNNDRIRDIGASILIITGAAGLVSVFNILKAERNEHEFITSLVVLKEDPSQQLQVLKFITDVRNNNMYPSFPSDHQISYISQEYSSAYPNKFKKNDEFHEFDTYYDIIGYFVLDILFENFNQSWLINRTNFETESGSLTTNKYIDNEVKEITVEWKDLTKDLSTDIYKVEELNRFRNPMNSTIKLPDGSKISIDIDKWRQIFQIDNKYSTVTITLRKSGGGIGFGKTGYYIGMNQSESEKFTNLSFSITVEQELKKWFSGSKTADYHKHWMNSIVGVLREKLDYSNYSNKLKEWREFQK